MALTPAQRLMQVQMGSLTPQTFANFNSINNKYPGISNDLVMSMVRQGLDANTPGLDRIATIDGIAALKADAFKVDKLKKKVDPDRGILGAVQSAFKETIYDPFKGTTRLLFAGLRSPYDATTATIRSLVALGRGEEGAAGQLLRDVTGGLTGESTQLGQIARGGFSLTGGLGGQGSGFFITPETKVGKAQAQAMGKYGRLNDKSFTIGRGIFSGVGMNPNSNAYNVSSGIVDAVLNVSLDISTWFGPGAVGKILTQGKTVTNLTKELSQVNKSGFDIMAKESLDELEKTGQVLRDAQTKKISSPYKRYASKYKKTEQEIIARETEITDIQTNTFKKLLNTSKDIYAWEGVDAAADAVLSPNALAKFIVENPAVQSGEFSKAIGLLSADMKNTAGFFDGFLIMDEVPRANAISIGVHAADEFAVTLKGTEDLKLLDMADTFVNATEKVRIAESANRTKFADALDKLARGKKDEVEFRILTQLSGRIREDMSNLEGFVGSLFSMGDELVAATPIAKLIAEVAEYNNPKVMAQISDLIQSVWKVDGFTNIRSIYGETGGVVVTNTKRLAAKSAEFGNAAAEILDPSNLGPNILKLLDSVKGGKDEIARLENELNTLSNKTLDLKDKENWFNSLREYAHNDPEILKELIQDPANSGIKNLLKLELEITEKNVFRESILAQMGVTDNFMGEVLDTPNADKALKFLLGRQFQPIAELIAKETNPVRLRRLFGRKLDDNMITELAAATNSDDVFKVFLNQFVPGGDPVTIKQSLSAGVKIATNPVARMVPGVNLDAIRYAENINKAFGRFYIRSTALNLNDLTGLNNGVEDWMSSLGIKKIVGRAAQEKIIADTQLNIFKATTPAERAKAVSSGIGKLMDEVGSTLSLSDDKIKELKELTKIAGGEEAFIKSYSLENALNNNGGAVLKTPGGDVRLPGGILEGQLVHDVINLPDSRMINQSVITYKTNVPLYGTAKSFRILLEETNDLWRTAQLVGRASYVFRNIAEMQMRQFFSGHNSLFNNPIGFIAMVMSDAEGNKLQQMLAKSSKYNVNALDEYFKTADAEVELSKSIIARRALMRGTSVGDYGKAGRQTSIFKAYQTVGVENPDFLKALAWTMNNFSSDKFMPDVIRILESANPQARAQYIDNLINTFDEPGNKLREFASAIYDNNDGMREILLKNPGLETGPGIVKENMNAENIAIWLFDETQPSSYAGQLNLLAGQGAQRNTVLSLIRDGEVLITSEGGKVVKLRTPYRQEGLTTEQVLAAEREYAKRVESLFKRDELTGSVATNVVEKTTAQGVTKQAQRFTDFFFNLAARAESKMNFGPEFDAAYWDYIAGYADMLDTKELITLRNNANKAFAPRGGKKILGRVPAPLRVINTTLKERLKKTDYVHAGGTSIKTLDGIAADQASNYVKNLFYDAARQKQWANSYRLVAPFAQAHYNTLGKWSQLTFANPVPIYKFGKAFDAATKEGSNVVYDISGMTYDDQQGFLYKDEQTQQLRFKMPVVGSVLGALAAQNINMKDALQITSPIESLNLAFGSLNPIVPGFGPAIVAGYQLSGRSSAFGPVDDIVRDILTPFGQPRTATDIIFPAWLKKISAAILGNDATTLRAVKDWASYLASTGEYGDNPLGNDQDRIKLFNDATRIARWNGIFGGLLQSITPSVPIQEVLVSIKNPENKQNFMTMTMLYNQLKVLREKYPADQGRAISEFAAQFGARNLLVAVSGSTPGSSGMEDAWTFLNNNPGANNKYARPSEDVIPFFFPGGEYSQKYYNWQVKSGARRKLSTAEIMQESEGLVYSMLKSQIAEQQIAGYYTGDWYAEQIAVLNKQFGGARPVDTLVTGISDARIAVLERALLDPAMQSSPVYKQISEFYPVFKRFKDSLNEIKVSNYAELSSKGGLPTLMRDELVALGEKLMTENPDFIRMYYGVFAGILKESK